MATFEHPHVMMRSEAAEGLARGAAERMRSMSNEQLFQAWVDLRRQTDKIMNSPQRITRLAMAQAYLTFLFRTEVLNREITENEAWSI